MAVTRQRRKEMAQEARVQKALEAFNEMAPGLTQYARSYLGNYTVMVKADKTTQTDGKTIMIRPPMALADNFVHERQGCGVRGIDGHILCDACDVRERVLTLMHHEIAHIAHGSFERYSKYKLTDTGTLGLVKGLFPEYATVQVRFGNDEKMTSLQLADGIHSHLAMVHLGIEDHRINTASFAKLPGLWKRMNEVSREIFENGVEGDNGVFVKWQELKPDEQIMVAPLFYMEGFDIEDAFDQQVVDAVFDPEARDILGAIADGKDSLSNFRDSARLLKIWRNHGLLLEHSKPRHEMSEEDQKAYDDFMEALRKLLRLLTGHGEHIGGKGDDIGCGGGHEHGAKGSSKSGTEDDPDEETFARVITANEYLDDVPGHMSGVNIFPPGQGTSARGPLDNIGKATEAVVGNAVAKCRIAFQVNARAKNHRNEKAGRVDARSLGKRAWNPADGRLFKSKTVPDKRDYEVLIGFDCSGSTSSSYGEYSRLQMLKYSVCALADTMQRLGVKFSIYAHNTGNGPVGYSSSKGGDSMDIYTIKTVDEPWLPEVRNRVCKQRAGGSNLDGHTLQFYRKQLDKSRATDKILMYFTDGVMPGTATHEELPVLQDEITQCAKRGYTLLGVGVFTNAPERHGLPTVRVDTPADYPSVIDHLAKRMQ